MFKVDKLPTKTDREPPGFQLPREVNKYLNRWKLSKPVLFFLTLLCMPNLVSGAPYEGDTPIKWAKDSLRAGRLPFPSNDVMEPTCKCIVGYLRDLWEGGAPIDAHGEMATKIFRAISNLRVTANNLQPSTQPYNFVRPHTGDMGSLLTSAQQSKA